MGFRVSSFGCKVSGLGISWFGSPFSGSKAEVQWIL